MDAHHGACSLFIAAEWKAATAKPIVLLTYKWMYATSGASLI
jgi:hypothetical protein